MIFRVFGWLRPYTAVADPSTRSLLVHPPVSLFSLPPPHTLVGHDGRLLDHTCFVTHVPPADRKGRGGGSQGAQVASGELFGKQIGVDSEGSWVRQGGSGARGDRVCCKIRCHMEHGKNNTFGDSYPYAPKLYNTPILLTPYKQTSQP